jgi:hypothetical protein
MCCALHARSLTCAASGVVLPASSLAGAVGAPMQRERACRAAETEQTVCSTAWSLGCLGNAATDTATAVVGCPTVRAARQLVQSY